MNYIQIIDFLIKIVRDIVLEKIFRRVFLSFHDIHVTVMETEIVIGNISQKLLSFEKSLRLRIVNNFTVTFYFNLFQLNSPI